MLPLEVRVVPTYNIAADAFQPFGLLIRTLTGIDVGIDWNLLNTYSGLTLPLVATATGKFLFRQFFMTVPDELAEAARMGGSGPWRFFIDILLRCRAPTCWHSPPSSSPTLGTSISGRADGDRPQLFHRHDRAAGAAPLRERPAGLERHQCGGADHRASAAHRRRVLQRWFVRGLIATEK